MFKEEILENERRRDIYQVLAKSPGLHFRELQRRLQFPLASLEYHIDYMVRKKIIFGEKEGRYKRYYVQPLDSEDKKVLSALRQKRMREIVLVILASKKAKYQFLEDFFQLPRSTLSFYIRYLVENNILVKDKVGYENIYTIKDEDRVARVLTAYKSSFLDELVDKALNIWMETHFYKERISST